MSTETLPGGKHAATVTASGTRIYLDASGEAVPDETLAAWRHAAISGGLPEPSRDRWQQLRAGVVNMWEFDAAEYWSADGRAQFVGRNEQGKSTMMAMTTLTMLTGDLSARYVDTFGESHRNFRYYLEPTEDPKDRRPTDNQLNRGWTWVEYGRLTETGPEYFTTLLFVQARRTSTDYTKKWVTHPGPERVRDGITLLHQKAVVTAGDLPTQPALTVHPSGKAYAKTVASTLFGLDPERLRTVVELLKTLRTPKLGNRLNPDWVIDQIRDALPPLDAAEIGELAEGWDQLGQLAADRDAAKEAQEAVAAYVKTTWNPWADATLRLAADDLVAAVTVLDDVTRDERTARKRAEHARTECAESEKAAGALAADLGQLGERRETLLKSQSYRDAADAGRQVADAATKTKGLQVALKRATDAHRTAQQQLAEAQRTHDDAEAALRTARETAGTDAGAAGRAAGTAGLPAESSAWAAAFDTARLEAAIAERRTHVREADKLDQVAGRARNAAEQDARLLGVAETEHTARKETADETAATFEDEAQRLSDALERWVETLHPAQAGTALTPPPVAVRERWLEAVLAECDRSRPTQQLTDLVRRDWTQPTIAPLEAKAVTADHDAKAALANATALDSDADRIESEPTPVPTTPHNWARRTRPAAGAHGAPLWELLDPIENLSDDTLAGLEAALAGAGLLDAWVTPDGVWRPDRDGHDHVITLSEAPAGGPNLGAVLVLAEPARDSGPLAVLADTAAQVLAGVGWRANRGSADTGEAVGPPVTTWVAADGSWHSPTTTGQAPIPASGAALLGATARAQDRARRVAARRAEAEQHRALARELTEAAEQHRAAASNVRRLAGAAPRDADVIGASVERATAHRELDKAATVVAERARAAQKSQNAQAEADAALLMYCSSANLDPARLQDVIAALDDATTRVRTLAQDANQIHHAQRLHQLRVDLLDNATNAASATDAEVGGLTRDLDVAQVALTAARDAVDSTDQDILDEVERLATRLELLGAEHAALVEKIKELSRAQGVAETKLTEVETKRQSAEEERSARLAAWWVPIDAGLAVARGIAAEDAARTLTAALTQARALRSEKRPPRGWPETAGIDGAREQILTRLRDRLAGPDFLRLNSTLNRTGGRSALIEHDDVSGLPQVQVLVDASNARFDPAAAIEALAHKAAQLGELHDEKMHNVMEELLASTFVDHLRDKVKQTEALLRDVNSVLGDHPTGTTRTVLRLRRKPVGEHAGGYQVLNRLLEDSVDSPAVQQQVQAFLSGQIRDAQDEGHAEGRDWKELLVEKLDYRRWFAVVTEWRVLSSAKEGATQTWRELTRERHAQDSGGGKVMTMLQPLLATLAALYENSTSAPRPLWLDEAFDGVDAENTNSLLGMLVDFDFDFVLAGPKSLVASRHVPCAAVWMVNRAPAPMPGVDLGLWLYGRGTQEKIALGEQTWTETPDSEADSDSTTGEETLWP